MRYAARSTSAGIGRRSVGTDALNFANSNYAILENIKSGVAEWNSILSSNKSNSLIVGYTTNDESRPQSGSLFPFVDILKDSTVYTSFGFEPFTPNNELKYQTFQLQDSFTKYGNRHSLTFGGAFEKYYSENVFFPGKQSAYVYNTLADFYTDANGYLANPNRTVSPVTLKLFQVRYMNDTSAAPSWLPQLPPANVPAPRHQATGKPPESRRASRATASARACAARTARNGSSGTM